MQNKLLSVLVAFFSIVGAFFSSKVFTYDEIEYEATNYMDMQFIDVSSHNNSNVIIVDNGKGIELKSLDISNDNKKEVISYRVLNNSSTYDVDMNIYINGNTYYENEYYIIYCSSLGRVNKGDTIEGSITIELKKDLTETIKIPFNIEIEANPIQKKYLF